MNVTSLDVGGFPSVARAEAQAGRAAARWAASMPPAWDSDVPPFGATGVTAVAIGSVPEDTVALAIRRDTAVGRLSIPVALAARWVDRAIGAGEAFAPARLLGPAERGVLIALVGPLLDPIGWSCALGPAPDLRGPAVVLRVASPAGPGPVWVQAPPAPAAARPFSIDRARALAIEAALQLGTTALPRAALSDLAPGDLVVFDGVPAASVVDDQPWQSEIAIGAFRAAGRIEADGRVSIVEGWKNGRKSGWKTDRTSGKDVSMDPDKTDTATAALAAAPVEVVAELGRITLRGDEVLGLAPGVVLGLRVERTSAVSLRIGGEPWAEGELVNVEGELGVRVTRLLPR